jgi:hypothetical protein
VNNDKILRLAIEAGVVNYIDHETPRHYFVDTMVDVGDLERFAQSIVSACADMVTDQQFGNPSAGNKIKQRFGVIE